MAAPNFIHEIQVHDYGFFGSVADIDAAYRDDGTITSKHPYGITLTNGGSGYSAAFDVTTSGGTGTNAKWRAYTVGGVIVSLVQIQPGDNNYNGTETPNFSAGGGSGATGTLEFLIKMMPVPFHCGYARFSIFGFPPESSTFPDDSRSSRRRRNPVY